MRELTVYEVNQASGGFDAWTNDPGIFGPSSLGAASRFAGGVG